MAFLGKTLPEYLRVEQVWIKGYVVAGYDPNIWRQDRFGCWMNRFEYGNRDSPFGWEFNHIISRSRGGSDDIVNLEPMYWANNVRLSDNPFL